MDKELTGRQQKALDFIVSFVDENGFSPSATEISKHIGVSLRGATLNIATLANKGYISHLPNARRSITVIGKRVRPGENQFIRWYSGLPVKTQRKIFDLVGGGK